MRKKLVEQNGDKGQVDKLKKEREREEREGTETESSLSAAL